MVPTFGEMPRKSFQSKDQKHMLTYFLGYFYGFMFSLTKSLIPLEFMVCDIAVI